MSMSEVLSAQQADVLSNAQVTIGIPNYQRPKELQRCLRSLCSQTYENIAIIVSDDCSPDPDVRTVMQRAAEADRRVLAIYQPANIGMFKNFDAVLRMAKSPYFMWSSNDDYWDPEFVGAMVCLLEGNPRAAMACGALRHFKEDIVSPTIYSPKRFSSTDNKDADLERFLVEPEILGKSHLLYGLYRTELLSSAIHTYGFGDYDRWSEDVLIPFAVMCRHPILAVDRPYLFKHVRKRLEFAPKRFAKDFGIPSGHHREYLNGLLDACATEAQRQLVLRVMRDRAIYKLAVTSWRKPLSRLASRIGI